MRGQGKGMGGQEDAVIWLSVSLDLGQHCGPSSITLQLLA